jgi:sigma-E factor negative regulatory protein RseA
MNPPAPLTAAAGTSERTRLRVSDLADGRLDGDELVGACGDWAIDAEARRTWHAYHLIGDVLRSEDLAADASRDAAFLAAVRGRLAAEPVVFAPVPAQLSVSSLASSPMSASGAAQALSARRRRNVWLVPMAAAAGFVAVAGVVAVLQQATPMGASAGPQMASGGGAMIVPVKASPPSGQMLRDAQVEAYLRAHREALDGSPAALPGGGVRNVDFTITQR